MKKQVLYGLMFLLLVFSRAVAAPVPKEAQKHMAWGATALEMAKDEDGFKKAAEEFEAAAKLAPKWPDPYYNLGIVYSKLNDLDNALGSYEKYLKLAPHAKDAKAVENEIFKLEYTKQQQLKELERNNNLTGWWYGSHGGRRTAFRSVSVVEDCIALNAQGPIQSMQINIPGYMRVDIPNLGIKDGKFSTSVGAAQYFQCPATFKEIKGSFNQGDRELKFEYTLIVAGPPCTDIGGALVNPYNSFYRGNFLGIRLYLKDGPGGKDFGNKIEDLWPNGPGQAAGIKKDDKILKINGTDFKPMCNMDLSSLINGFPKDTVITIAVRRSGVDKPLEFTFKRP